jgi:hypothetical protein
MADEEKPEALELPIEWHLPESLITRFVTNMVVQYNGPEFIISFFETMPPVILGEITEEVAREKLSSIRAECVARVVVATERMPAFVKALQTNLERHQSIKADKKEEEE